MFQLTRLIATGWLLISIVLPCGCQQDMSLSVQKLLQPTQRDEALFELLRGNQYRPSMPLTKDNCRVNEVVICPQQNGPPLYAVFKAERYEKHIGGGSGKRLGHVILFDHKGDIIPIYRNANSIEGSFKDVNQDGVVEAVESWTVGLGKRKGDRCLPPYRAEILHVIPMTRKQEPILRVAYNKNDPDDKWGWQLVETKVAGEFDIVLGPDDDKTGKVERAVVYRWSVIEKKYTGPPGGYDQPYMRFTAPGYEQATKFAAPIEQPMAQSGC